MTKFLTLKEAAEIAGVTPDSLGQAIRRGSLEAHRFGRQWVVTSEALDRYLSSTARGWDKRRARKRAERETAEAMRKIEHAGMVMRVWRETFGVE